VFRALHILSRPSAFPPYVKGTLFPALCPAPLQCAPQRYSIAPNRRANTFNPVPSELPVVQRWRTDTCLPFSSELYNVVTGKEPRLWNCPKSSCHGAFPDTTRNPLEPSRVQNSPFLRGTRGVVLLSSRVWKDVNGWALEIGISCTYSNPVVTGGQKHTHHGSVLHRGINNVVTSTGTVRVAEPLGVPGQTHWHGRINLGHGKGANGAISNLLS
jgi:hypothetical protein